MLLWSPLEDWRDPTRALGCLLEALKGGTPRAVWDAFLEPRTGLAWRPPKAHMEMPLWSLHWRDPMAP